MKKNHVNLLTLLQAPLLAAAVKVPIRKIGDDAVVTGNRVSWTTDDGWEDGLAVLLPKFSA